MDERNHLELREIAEQASARIRHITDSLSELRANYDGPAIADNISEIEIVYAEIAELQNEEQRAQRERSLARTRERFGLERLRQNQQLTTEGFVSLGRVIYHCERAIEAFERWISNLRQSQPFDEDVNTAIAETGEALHCAYLISRPPT
jgi:hypothetical protein